MSTDYLPRVPVTLMLGAWMVGVYLGSPPITEMSYVVLAPWLHAGWSHFWNNLLVFGLLGAWIEMRVGWIVFFVFAVLIPYLALFAPVAFGYGGLSTGASSLTMALTGYAIPVLLTMLAGRIESFTLNQREASVGGLQLIVAVYLTADALRTTKRFVGVAPRPDGLAVTAHFTALTLGLLWFTSRAWRHGVAEA